MSIMSTNLRGIESCWLYSSSPQHAFKTSNGPFSNFDHRAFSEPRPKPPECQHDVDDNGSISCCLDVCQGFERIKTRATVCTYTRYTVLKPSRTLILLRPLNMSNICRLCQKTLLKLNLHLIRYSDK